MNDFQEGLADTAERTLSERHIETIRQVGGLFVEAMRVTSMPMVVTDSTLPGNPITFANQAFIDLSGYTIDELLGQEPHFMNGVDTDPATVRQYARAIREGRDEALEILQYRKDGAPFRAMLFASPIANGDGKVTSHVLSYLDITRRYEAEKDLRELTAGLEKRVAARTTELEAANARLEGLVAERDMLMVEVNHRAKNSLAVAASLLHIQGGRQPDPLVKALFREAQDHLGAMARLHDLLSRSENAQRVDLATYVAALCEELRSLTGDGSRIRLHAAATDDIPIAPDTAFPLGIVLTELITNAVKYAYPEPSSGVIRVMATRIANAVQLIVEDDGIGMSTPRNGSLGYGLVRALVRQIKGEISIKSEKGVAITISFAL